MFGVQLVVLFWKVMEPLGGGALWEKVDHWRQSRGFHSLVAFPV